MDTQMPDLFKLREKYTVQIRKNRRPASPVQRRQIFIRGHDSQNPEKWTQMYEDYCRGLQNAVEDENSPSPSCMLQSAMWLKSLFNVEQVPRSAKMNAAQPILRAIQLLRDTHKDFLPELYETLGLLAYHFNDQFTISDVAFDDMVLSQIVAKQILMMVYNEFVQRKHNRLLEFIEVLGEKRYFETLNELPQEWTDAPQNKKLFIPVIIACYCTLEHERMEDFIADQSNRISFIYVKEEIEANIKKYHVEKQQLLNILLTHSIIFDPIYYQFMNNKEMSDHTIVTLFKMLSQQEPKFKLQEQTISKMISYSVVNESIVEYALKALKLNLVNSPDSSEYTALELVKPLDLDICKYYLDEQEVNALQLFGVFKQEIAELLEEISKGEGRNILSRELMRLMREDPITSWEELLSKGGKEKRKDHRL